MAGKDKELMERALANAVDPSTSSFQQPRNVQAVFFDAGQTLVEVRSSVGAVYAAAAGHHGIRVDPRELDRRFPAAWKRSTLRAEKRRYRCSDEILRQEWREIVTETFGVKLPGEKLSALFDEVYERFSSPEAWRVVAGIPETLEALRNLGVRLGVLSNWDSRLPRLLEKLGLRDRFDFLVVSYEVRFEKPHPAMFHRALELAGVTPRRALHVGDSWQADILPARQLGLHTLWLSRAGPPGAGADAGIILERFPQDPRGFWSRILEDGTAPGLAS